MEFYDEEYIQDWLNSYDSVIDTLDNMDDDVNVQEMRDFLREVKKDFEGRFLDEYREKENDLQEMGEDDYEGEYEERCHEYWSDQF